MTGGALSGITVLELAEGVAGPYCGRLLALHGARVIKVEPPKAGDAARRLSPRRRIKLPWRHILAVIAWMWSSCTLLSRKRRCPIS